MLNFLDRLQDPAYALLRIVSGFMFSFHGAQKLLGIYSDFRPPAGTQLWFGGIIELVGGVAIMLGFRARLAAFLCSGTMAVAYLQFHWKGQWDRNLLPALNQGEMAALYALVFLFIATRGSGTWSLDRMRRRRS
jgi:putative oxidoreductase